MIAKAALVQSVLEQLSEEHRVLVAAQRATAAGVTHEESRAEGDKDMRSTEASYLARGQAARVAELEEAILRLRGLELRTFDARTPIAASALVSLSGAGKSLRVLLLPVGGGAKVSAPDGKPVRVISTVSPLGSALLGCLVGDDVEVERERDVLEYTVIAVE